jgi:hypothetical protein
VQPGASKATAAGAATGSNGGGFTIGNAVSLAASVTPMMMVMKMGMFNPSFFQALGASGNLGTGFSGGIPGMPKAGLAPGMGSFASMLQATQSVLGSADPSEESKAVGDALNKTVKDVTKALKK